MDPSQPDAFVGGRLMFHTGGLLLGRQEGINRVLIPTRIRSLGNRRAHRRLEGPVIPGIALGSLVGGAFGALGDPVSKQLNLDGCQRFPLGGHFRGFLLRSHPFEQLALSGVLQIDPRSLVAAFANEFGRVETQTAFLLQHAMAREASLLENRLDLFEIVDRLACLRNPWREQGERQKPCGQLFGNRHIGILDHRGQDDPGEERSGGSQILRIITQSEGGHKWLAGQIAGPRNSSRASVPGNEKGSREMPRLPSMCWHAE